MKIRILILSLTLFIFAFAAIVNANLLTNGDFEDTSATINGAAFTLGTSTFSEWYALGTWDVESGGPTGSAWYFEHDVTDAGGGGDERAFQPIDTSGMSLTNVEMILSLDYIFLDGIYSVEQMDIAVVGLSGDGAEYRAWNGGGYDGYPSFWDPDLDVATERDVLVTKSLSQTLLSNGNDGWEDDSLSFIVPHEYDSLIVVARSGAWPGEETVPGLRGIDNVSLSLKPVPEPATMLLLGSGLLGLAGFRKRFKR